MDKIFIVKPTNHSPDNSPTTSSTVFSPSGTVTSTEFSSEGDSDIDDNSFLCLKTNHAIVRKSWVAYKEVGVVERGDSGKRIVHQTNYLIAQVLNVIDNKSYNLKFVEYVKHQRFKPYYTWDVNRPDKIISNKDELVHLKAPDYLLQPKEVKQGAKIAPEHTDFIHNFFSLIFYKKLYNLILKI